ncbi:MAG: nodulation protein NfeD [bacterium]|nr:nodulation protein NfeD [bacterium]
MKQKLLLILFGFLILGPIISFSLKLIIAEPVNAQPGYYAPIESVLTQVDSSIRKSDDSARATRPGIDSLIRSGGSSVVIRLDIDGTIGAVTDDRIEDAIEKAVKENASLLVIYLDTPGGFTKPTWSITKRFLNSPVPICIYIAPSGARAGSAGVYMTYAAHFAAMAPSTNIGAAHPVAGGGQEVDSIMNEKITNDAAAQIKGFADKRGRNATWAEQAVRQSVSITDKEALDSNVIDIRAENYEDLLRQINGRETELPSGKVTMNLTNVRTETIKISFAYKLLELLTQPDIAFILFSIGGLGIVLELYNPGSILPGVVGVIALILAFYSFQTLPINWAGAALIVLAIILFIAEIKVVSHGLLTVGGVIALFLGGLMLIDAVDPSLRVSKSILITVVSLIGITMAAAFYVVYKARMAKPFSGQSAMIGRQGTMHSDGFVYIEGALWKVTADEALNIGDKVEVVAVESLTLKVRKHIS